MQVMQSNKWTFSLASLVILLAIGLAFAPVSVMADETEVNIGGEKIKKNPAHPKVTLSVPDALPRGETENTDANSVIDASSMTGLQMLRPTGTDGVLKIRAEWSIFINLADFTNVDFELTGYDKDGFAVTLPDAAEDGGADEITVAHADVNPNGKNYVVTIPMERIGDDEDAINGIATLYVLVKKDAVTNPDPAIHPAFAGHPKNPASARLKIELVTDNDAEDADDADDSDPMVISVTRVPDVSTPVSGVFTLEVVLSEMPASAVGPGSFTVTNGTVSKVDAGASYDVEDTDGDGDVDSDDDADNPMATGFDDKLYPYYLTVTPKLDIDDPAMVTVKVNDFMDTNQPKANEYSAGLDPNYEILIAAAATTGPAAGFSLPTDVSNQKALPAVTIPAGGYLVLLNHDAEVGHDKHAGVQTPAETDDYVVTQKYSWQGANLHAADLESFFRNGGTVQVIGPTGTTAESVIISEIMWGSLNGDIKNQWIELQNTGTADLVIAANTWFLGVYGPAGRSAADLAADTASAVVDEMSNSPGGVYWSVAGKGQSGRTTANPGEPNEDAISMYRVIIAGVAGDGTMAGSWMQSALPSANLRGLRVGTPGAASPEGMAPVVTDPVVEDPVVEEPTATVATAADIVISEIMVASNDGRLPQWIELVSTSAMDLSLAGWSVVIDNSDDDADVHGAGAQIQVDIGDVMVGAGQTVLIVSKEGRNSGVGMGDGDIRADRIVDLSDTLMPESMRYTVLSEMGFTVALMPPQTGAIRMSGDTVGNLGEGWDIPMAESGRSSIVRREMGVDMMAIMGTAEKGWVLASDTALAGAYVSTYYGSDEDVGTPGYDAGGPLPVELSMFYPARDKVTGQVVITWETQSELNNAGFFIKRSEQPDGKFLVINPTMIPGAGTTAEKQSYTHTDTTAKPNVLYYYQIEDVSLDGKRATLTGAHRLRGHIGAAGKVTTIWGELKAQE